MNEKIRVGEWERERERDKHKNTSQKQTQIIPHQNWQVLIKMAAYKNRKSRIYGFAFKAIKLNGGTLFKGGANSGRKSQYMVA